MQVKQPFLGKPPFVKRLEMCDREYEACIKECEYINDLKFNGNKDSQFYKVCTMTCKKKFDICINKVFKHRDKQLIFVKPI